MKASLMIAYYMPFNTSNNKKKTIPSPTEQRGQVFLNSSPDYFFTEAASSSFRTNFFLRASEIKVAESSSLRDVQPLLYLQRDPIKKNK